MNDSDGRDPKADATRERDLREAERHQQDSVRRNDPGVKNGDADHGYEPEAVPPLSKDADADAQPQTELEILRGELAAVHGMVAEAERELEEHKLRALRARAEVDTLRRRAAGEENRARQAGLESAVLPVLNVFDDLRRALAAAETTDPAQIVPGVRAVMEGLERNLDRLGIERVGEVGDAFDPDLHEALTTAPSGDATKVGTIAEVFEAGFRHGERLIRPARVVVFQDGTG